MTLLSIEGLGISFGGLKAVNDVSFTVKPGEIVSVIGPNGAGKTTLFNMISGVYAPTSGEIFFNGVPTHGKKPHEMAALGLLAEEARALNEALAMKGKSPEKSAKIATLLAAILDQGSVLGLCVRDSSEVLEQIQSRKLERSGLDSADIQSVIDERNAARRDKDFARADAARDKLLEMGVSVMDTPEGTRWKVN